MNNKLNTKNLFVIIFFTTKNNNYQQYQNDLHKFRFKNRHNYKFKINIEYQKN